MLLVVTSRDECHFQIFECEILSTISETSCEKTGLLTEEGKADACPSISYPAKSTKDEIPILHPVENKSAGESKKMYDGSGKKVPREYSELASICFSRNMSSQEEVLYH